MVELQAQIFFLGVLILLHILVLYANIARLKDRVRSLERMVFRQLDAGDRAAEEVRKKLYNG